MFGQRLDSVIDGCWCRVLKILQRKRSGARGDSGDREKTVGPMADLPARTIPGGHYGTVNSSKGRPPSCSGWENVGREIFVRGCRRGGGWPRGTSIHLSANGSIRVDCRAVEGIGVNALSATEGSLVARYYFRNISHMISHACVRIECGQVGYTHLRLNSSAGEFVEVFASE